jgi:cell division inhibitor SulA
VIFQAKLSYQWTYIAGMNVVKVMLLVAANSRNAAIDDPGGIDEN